jgi:primosomal protein N''
MEMGNKFKFYVDKTMKNMQKITEEKFVGALCQYGFLIKYWEKIFNRLCLAA